REDAIALGVAVNRHVRAGWIRCDRQAGVGPPQRRVLALIVIGDERLVVDLRRRTTLGLGLAGLRPIEVGETEMSVGALGVVSQRFRVELDGFRERAAAISLGLRCVVLERPASALAIDRFPTLDLLERLLGELAHSLPLALELLEAQDWLLCALAEARGLRS